MIDELANALLNADNLRLRSLLQDALIEFPEICKWPTPVSCDPRVMAAAAALTELCALRHGQSAPAWTAAVEPLLEPMFVVKSASTMKRLRKLCETESPLPLRKRGFYAPPNFLEFA